ncbi:SpoIIE family protein phosphatase [Mycobacterium sp. MYCO198283]|uniref:PP2C family protein-serine/threonine phosphatase n=1 Tax=Mycobacterium sp. MYCO198283 TaxID=2883505 RepID=UPI001E54A870|nr:SpoIIE family protein phosphatase [Mycobacterium sp. MYCO198283]MCG5432021.1 SpoIIE family protein phosphatase [Mycobacterium sp. MYCO198283]
MTGSDDTRWATLVDEAPCGFLVASPDRRILAVNATLARWVGRPAADLVGRRFTDLLSVGSRIHFETHFAPLLTLRGELSGVAAELAGNRMPVFLAANTWAGDDGAPAGWRVTVDDARDRRSYERELLDARRRADEERARVQVAMRTLQSSLLPPGLAPPTGLTAEAHYHAAAAGEIGGDFYDLFPLTSDTWGFFLGDVCGKGIDAALLTSLTRYTLRAAAVFDADPVAVLQNLQAVLRQESHGDPMRFATVLYGLLSRTNDGFTVRIAGGGHPPALLLRADGSVELLDTRYGQAVGIFRAPRFVAAAGRLCPGDTLLLYTDGLTEARTGRGAERFDDDGALLDFAARHAPATAASVVAAVRALLTELGAGVEDDVAVLAIGVPPASPIG